jgi:type IV pilus assembly protein PilW
MKRLNYYRQCGRQCGRQRGLTMVELLVALTIGSLLIVGAVFVYSQSRNTASVSDTVARLQENTRFALAVMEPDVQLAGAYGYNNNPSDMRYKGATEVAITDMRQDDTKYSSAPAAAHACGKNFALDLVATIQGVEKGFGLDCTAFGSGNVPDADTLIIRRASATPRALNPKILQVYSNRLAPWTEWLFNAGTAPGPLEADMLDIRDLIVNVYYVSKDSDSRTNYPSLRRKSLMVDGTGTYTMDDQEIMSGVEDMQVQFGVDMGVDADGDGKIDDDDDNKIADVVNGQVVRYINPDDAASTKFGQIASVRVWLRMRAEQGEVGYSDNQTYEYGSVKFEPKGDNIRRLVTSRTFFLRNARTLQD